MGHGAVRKGLGRDHLALARGNVCVILKTPSTAARIYVIYQPEDDTVLNPKWEKAGFEVLSQFCWADFSNQLDDNFLKPNWWLLRFVRG